MADPTSVRQRIISSVFSRRNAAGTLEEVYVAHIKIWEDAGPEGGGRKPRYILISESSNGSGFMHKSKLNSNGSFSVGKTWNLVEVRAIQVLNPTLFNITLSRTYTWQTENPTDQSNFLAVLIRLFNQVAGGAASLHLEGIQNPDPPPYRSPSPRQAGPSNSSAMASTRDQISTGNRPPSPSRSQVNTVRSRPARPAIPAGAPSTFNAISPINPPSITARLAPMDRPQQDRSLQPSRPSLEVPSGRSYSPQPVSGLTPSTSRAQPVSPTLPSSSLKQPSPGGTPASAEGPHPRREHKDRVSFFDPANQATLDRLIAGNSGAQSDGEVEEESVQATMADVEEMLDGYEWASDNVLGRKTSRGAADLIEARLLDELTALDKANVYSFLESDDRIGVVLKHLDQAIAELDNMDSLVSSYKIHLNAVNDDISYIQSQNRGLQVQTQNQRTLLTELENLLQTVQVDRETLNILTQGSLEKAAGMQRLEESATQLYKALQAGRDTDMAATMERLNEYKTHNTQFCKRLFDFLSIMFTAQAKMLLGETDGIIKSDGRGRPVIINHEEMESYLARYVGLVLYLKEMDESLYAKLCAAYFSAASELHNKQIKSLFSLYANSVKKASDDDPEPQFSNTPTSATFKATSGIRRAGTIIRSPRDKERSTDKDIRGSEVFALILEQVAPQIYREEAFITNFFRTNDNAFTFADYMGLDNYFRRQAARAAGLSQSTMKLVRGAMDLIFGFFPNEMKNWLDNALAIDNMEVIGVTACLERFLVDAEERGNAFLQSVLDKQHTRLKALFDRHVNEQIQAIERNKLTSKKRQGVVSFVKYFPTYVSRVENQLVGADGLEIRANVDLAYEKIVNTMFDSLKQMATMDGEGDDKGQLNYHVIMIENMHHFVADIAQLEIGSMKTFVKKAETIYEENLSVYVKLVLRRPFAKILDYFEGIERLLKTTAPTEVASNSNFNPSSLKKVVKEYNAKDIRKHIDVLFKRVEKHFTEASEKATTQKGGIASGTVMIGVWKACEAETLRITELFSKRISQCYAQSSVSLEYSVTDVEAAFRGNRA